MSRERHIQLRNVQNVANGSTALISCPIGPRYKYIGLKLGSNDATNLGTAAACVAIATDIKVKLNGRIQRNYTGTELDVLNSAMGSSFAALHNGDASGAGGKAIVPIFFSEPWRPSAGDREALALPTAWRGGNFETFQIEVAITQASPTLEAFAVVDDVIPELPQGQNVPWLMKCIRQNWSASGSTFDITNFDRRDLWSMLTIKDQTANSKFPQRVTLRKNGEILHELTGFEDNALNRQLAQMSPGTWDEDAPTSSGGYRHIVFDQDDTVLGPLSKFENMFEARDIALTLEAYSTAFDGTVTTLLQRLGPPE